MVNDMGKKTRKILIIVLSIALLASLGVIGYELTEYKKGGDEYQKAEELAGIPDLADVDVSATDASATDAATGTDTQGNVVWVDSYADALRSMDLSALKKVNSDVKGWIYIPNTVISYPLVHGPERASTFYLSHTWSGDSSIVGAIFIEPANSGSLGNFNTVIYGHNMNNGSMFGTLKNFKSQSYWKSHKNIYINTDAGSRCYQIFAAYEVSTQGTTYQISFSGDQSKQEFIDYCLKQSLISTGVKPGVNDNIITLSTCTGHGHATRWVVQAVLKNTAPAASAAPVTPVASASPTPSTDTDIAESPVVTESVSPSVEVPEPSETQPLS
jgi:sortase B